ncbi:cellulose biosynthesis cyclic di-GMP-binding regulatory protein BcsB [Rhizobium sp. CFBP 8762]|uniref:cellulose biosynthesis cyclic di-GMP-binding regulatory protein BcsB n=1 Tax=Rhizobium sp. CFBP 8762 TaxID=2775279 RepID=UPI001A7E4199|nr:cellulose biosynthesis cyclic di-GMP-binding regulatory protein BcsB [Rhizobium sp. CFBP 8762]
MVRLGRYLLTSSLTLGLLTGAAFAQTLVDPAPSQTQTGRSTAPAGGSLLGNDTPAPGAPAAVATQALIPFEQALDQFNLDGEDGSTHLTFSLAASQLADGGALVLAYQNAVSVIPDASQLDIEVNGRAVGSVQIASPNGLKTESIRLNADFLREGRNDVTLRARQYHRVDCSLEATYELWTRIDPLTSGFAPVKRQGFTTPSDLLAVGRNSAGLTDLTLVIDGAVSPQMVNDAAPLMETLTLFLNRQDISVSVSNTPGSGPGIDVFVGTTQTRAQNAALNATFDAAAPGLSVRDGTTEGRASVFLKGNTSAELSRSLASAVQGPMSKGFQSGIFAPRSGSLQVEPSTTYTLADTGFTSRSFAGRLSRTSFDLVMPSDFYPADYGAIDLQLRAATSPGLKRTSQLLVRVNDLVIRSFPFRNTDGQEFKGKLIELPLRSFRPGVNRVELVAEVPMDSDDVCAPGRNDSGRPRLAMLDTTSLYVPPLARIGRLPDLSAFAGLGYPYSGGKAFDVFVDRPEPRSLSATMTLMARLALSARQPLNATVAFAQPNPSSARNALVMKSTNSASVAGLPLTSVGRGPSVEAGVSDEGATGAIAQDLPSPAPRDTGALLDAFRKSTAQLDEERSFKAELRDWFNNATRRFARWLNYENLDQPLAIDPQDSVVSVSQTQSPDGEATWTVVEARSPQDLLTGTNRLLQPFIWDRLQGGSAAIETANLSLVSLPATSRYIAEITDQTPGNIRRLAAAWFSDNFQFYVVMVVVLMGVFALWLGWLVPRKGVRTDK